MSQAFVDSGAVAESVPTATWDAARRYSEQRREASFAAVLLFAEPVDCLKREIVCEVAAEYPMLGVEEQAELNSELRTGRHFETGLRSNAAGHRHLSRLSSEPGRYDADFAYALRHSYAYEGARDAVGSHTSWVRVSTDSESAAAPDRFRAATATTCIAAAFAKIPGCLGVYLPGANLIVSPQRWCRAADEAVMGEFPVDAWIAIAVNRTEGGGARNALVSCSSIGLAAFDGHEIHLPWSDMPPGDAARLVFSALWMLLIGGARFNDGDTMGETGNTDRIRIRHAVEGKHGMQTDAWVLFDPSTVVQEEKLFATEKEPEQDMPPAPRRRRFSRLFNSGSSHP